jgi:hypothetical protein
MKTMANSAFIFPMSSRLISFLSEIEQALVQHSSSAPGATWAVTRMVSYHNSLARMVLTPLAALDNTHGRGSIFLQSFALADGSLCVKATLSWDGNDAHPIISVYSKPLVDWTGEADRIASAWIAGPAAVINTAPALFEVAS